MSRCEWEGRSLRRSSGLSGRPKPATPPLYEVTEDFLGRPVSQNVVESCKCFSNNERAVRVRPAFFAQCIDDAVSGIDILRSEARGHHSITAVPDWFHCHPALHNAKLGTHADDTPAQSPRRQ